MRTEKEPQAGDAHDGTVSPEGGSSFTSEAPKTFGATLLRLGPGMIIAGSIVGSGELIATTKAGAEAGFWLLWLIIIGCVIKVSTQIEFGRHAITWGQTPLKALNDLPGPRVRVNWLLWYWMIMTVLVISQQGGIVGGVGQALAITRPLTRYGAEYNRVHDELVKVRVEQAVARRREAGSDEVSKLQQRIDSLMTQVEGMPESKDAYLWAALLAVVSSVLLYIGRFRLIQVVATVLVSVFTLVTIMTLIMLQTRDEWAVAPHELARGLSFRLPPAGEALAANPVATALAAFGIIGVGAAELIMYPYWCLEKGYAKLTGPRDGTAQWVSRARGWLRVLHIDAWLSMVLYTFATAAFYLLGAAVLWRASLNPAKAEMIRTLSQMYVPVFGAWAQPVFLAGAFAVLYSTFFVAAGGNARMVADAIGLFGLTDGSEAARVKWTRTISAVWPLLAAVIYILVRRPTAMVLASGTAQAIMLPMLGAAALYFRYRRRDENLRSGRLWDGMLWLSFAGFAIIGGWSLVSVFWR
ncbi:MAG: Nramp family divalent metal transporter [Phycisphaerales bacterium]|nr:MAG: Nramp family divalent metal transporter [Phycisphaerales bacterium]